METTHNGAGWKILVVEDDPEQARTMTRLLAKKFSADIDTAGDLAEARDALEANQYDTVITDFQLPDGSGLDLLEEITSQAVHPPVILVTGQGDEETAAEAFRLQASGYVVKDGRLPTMVPEILSRTLKGVSLRRAEDELLRVQQNQRALLDATPEALLLIDRDGVILTINETGARRLGGTPEEMAGTRLTDYLDPSLGASRQQQFDLVERTSEPVWFEDERNGVALSNVLYPVVGKDATVERVAVFSQDITERKTGEEALRKAHEELEERVLDRTSQLRRANEDLRGEIEERKRAEASLLALSRSVQEQARVLDQILSASAQHFYLFDNRGKFIYASRPAADLLGLEQTDFSGKYWWDLGFPDSVMRALDIERENVLNTGQPWRGHLQFPTAAGVRDFEYILSPIVRTEGTVDTVVAAARDVTEEMNANEELAVRTARLAEQALLLDLTRETIVVRDMGGRIILWNAGAEEMWGWQRSEAIGKEQAALLETEFSIPVDEVEEMLLQDGHWEGELVQTARDGRRLHVSSRQVMRWGEGHQPEAVLEIDSDISERRALQSGLEARVASLERKERLLDLIPCPVLISDMNRVVTFWNAQAELVFGWTSAEAVGKVSHELLKAEFSRPLEDVESNLLNYGTWQGEMACRAKDGRRLTATCRRALERDESDEPLSIIDVVC